MRYFSLVFTLFALLLLQACGGDDDPPPAPAPRTSPTVPAPAPGTSAATSPQQALAPRSAIEETWPPAARPGEALTLEDDLTRKNYILVFDGSGSMADSSCGGGRPKCDAAKDAVIAWSSTLPVEANLGLIVFDEAGFSVRLPLGRNNREAFVNEIGKIRPNYQTPLTQSLLSSYELLGTQARRQLGYGEYNVVVVTDGIANHPELLTQAVDEVLRRTPIMIHTIGFCISGAHSLNQAGRTVYKAADNPEELRRGLDEVLAEAPDFDIADFQ